MRLGNILAIASLTMLFMGILFQLIFGYDLTYFDIFNIVVSVGLFWYGWRKRNRRTATYYTRSRY